MASPPHPLLCSGDNSTISDQQVQPSGSRQSHPMQSDGPICVYLGAF